jgi:RHS repeat-associated protein
MGCLKLTYEPEFCFSLAQDQEKPLTRTKKRLSTYKVKFQGQKREEELGLNWDSFKYRNYDFAIGRFMSIDPLTEEYHTWSPYVFSGNRVMDSRELEGLEPHSVHKSLQEAARNFSTQYNGYSIRENVEVATQFYKNECGEFSYTTPQKFTTSLSDPTQANDFPPSTIMVGDGHTHGADDNFNVLINKETSGNPLINPKGLDIEKIKDFDIQNGSNAPSGQDKEHFEDQGKDKNFMASYVFTPSGLAYSSKVNPVTGKVETNINFNLSKTNPSDPKSNLRMNEVSPNADPQVIPKQGEILKD